MVSRVVFATSVLLLAGSCGDEPREIRVTNGSILEVTSEAFDPGDPMPVEHTCDGADDPPPLRWTGARPAEWVVIMRDPDAGGFVHWLLYGIPGEITELETNELPDAAQEGANDFGSFGYRGPCPPEGDEAHDYEITVYGLDKASGLPRDATLQTVAATIEPLIAASGTLTTTYER